MKLRRQLLSCWRADFFSPRGFLIRALLIAAAFAVVQLAGWRDHTSVLAGTVGPSSAGRETSAILGVAYLAAYMAFVIVTPVLLLAAAILTLLERLSHRKQTSSPGRF
jgi:phosphotransferase system  glucose/maltose/N-acetylglucosamine-specific IIC component